jgi:hypothetical protein
MCLGCGVYVGSGSNGNNSDENMGMKKIYQTDEFLWAGVQYIGQQERCDNFSLDMFTDLITGSTFLRIPSESVMEARDRIRKGYGMV